MWGMDIRAKIVLKKRHGRNPTAQELHNASSSDEKFRATPEEVERAFDEGHAVRFSNFRSYPRVIFTDRLGSSFNRGV